MLYTGVHTASNLLFISAPFDVRRRAVPLQVYRSEAAPTLLSPTKLNDIINELAWQRFLVALNWMVFWALQAVKNITLPVGVLHGADTFFSSRGSS